MNRIRHRDPCTWARPRLLAMRATIAAMLAVTNLIQAEEKDDPLAGQHVRVYAEPGRFGGWPANHGIWSWGDEILVGFSAGYHKDNGPNRHAIDHDKPEEHLLARPALAQKLVP